MLIWKCWNLYLLQAKRKGNAVGITLPLQMINSNDLQSFILYVKIHAHFEHDVLWFLLKYWWHVEYTPLLSSNDKPINHMDKVFQGVPHLIWGHINLPFPHVTPTTTPMLLLYCYIWNILSYWNMFTIFSTCLLVFIRLCFW